MVQYFICHKDQYFYDLDMCKKQTGVAAEFYKEIFYLFKELNNDLLCLLINLILSENSLSKSFVCQLYRFCICLETQLYLVHLKFFGQKTTTFYMAYLLTLTFSSVAFPLLAAIRLGTSSI